MVETVSSLSSQRLQKSAGKILQVLLFFDVFCIITSSILLLFSTLSSSVNIHLNKRLLLQVSTVFGIYGLISFICNCLANYGIRKWRRFFLLPYLTFLPTVLVLLLIYLIGSSFMCGITEAIVLPLATSIVIMFIWLKLLKQWFAMAEPLDNVISPTQQEVESQALALATAIAILNLSPGQTEQDAADTRRDSPPPKYETLEVDMTAPPEYEEAVAASQEVYNNPSM